MAGEALPYGASAAQAQNFSVFIMDMAPELNSIEHTLRGEAPSVGASGTITWAPIQGAKPCMNELGIAFFMGELRAICTKSLTFSNLDRYEIAGACLDTCDEITLHLFYMYEAYELDLSYYGTLCMTVRNFTQFTAKRAQGAGERNAITRIIQEIHSALAEPKKNPIAKLFDSGGNKEG